eukprot:TRINITY_DN7613_c0_g1_i1.p1 TRINITY_DN7613_c0_g1~~TRINITY_DN7613_c0_g1_i1.p1  ORF type:complete len:178 (-),score=49.49 TRINITY_DN7613_c0_g1_i1:137-670(-)
MDRDEGQLAKDFDFLEVFRSALTSMRDQGVVQVVQELEIVYKCMEDRENDFRVAAEIGQMLVERNKQLMEDLDQANADWQSKYDDQQRTGNELQLSLSSFEKENEELIVHHREQAATNEELQRKCEFLQKEIFHVSEREIQFQEEMREMDAKIDKAKLEAKVNALYKEKTRQLFAEN